MVKTSVTEGKAKLSKLVERAARGHDVLITVRGKVKARLTKAEEVKKPKRFTKEENEEWLRELADLHQRVAGKKKPTITPQEWWDELRADRI